YSPLFPYTTLFRSPGLDSPIRSLMFPFVLVCETNIGSDEKTAWTCIGPPGIGEATDSSPLRAGQGVDSALPSRYARHRIETSLQVSRGLEAWHQAVPVGSLVLSLNGVST